MQHMGVFVVVVVVGNWLLSLSVMFSRFIHVVSGMSVFFYHSPPCWCEVISHCGSKLPVSWWISFPFATPPPTETSWGQGSDSKSQVPTIMPGKYLIKSYLVNDWFCHISGPFKVKMWFSTYKLIFILPWAKQLEGVSPPPLGKSCVNLTAQ